MNSSYIKNRLSTDFKAKMLDLFRRCLLLIMWAMVVLGLTGCQSMAVTSEARATTESLSTTPETTVGPVSTITREITVAPVTPTPSVSEDIQAVALNQLGEDSRQPLKIHFEDGIPTFVSVDVPMPSDSPDDPVVRALNFLEKYRDLYLLQDPRSQFFLERIVTNELGQHLFFGQRRDEIPVFGAELAVHLRDNAVMATNGKYLTNIPVFPSPVIDEERARQIAIKDLAGTDPHQLGESKIVYFNVSLFVTPTDVPQGEIDAETYQAWQLTIVDNGGIVWMYFVDAQMGDVLHRLTLSTTHSPRKDFHISTANNTGRRWNTACGYPSGTDWFDENGPLPGTSPDTEGFGAFSSANQVYDFYYNNFHQHSWDSREAIIWITLDDSDWAGNAIHSKLCNDFVFGDNMATLDIIAHEITHGVTAGTAQYAGLWYENQPGALSESYSDVFAALIDIANWTIGEGSAAGQKCSFALPAGAVRDMSKPPNCGHPDHMLSTLSGERADRDGDCPGDTNGDGQFCRPGDSGVDEDPRDGIDNDNDCPGDTNSDGRVCWFGDTKVDEDAPGGFQPLPVGQGVECDDNKVTYNDCGFVHTNSGIPNKVAFLIIAGGTHNGITVNGIGRVKTAQLYYDVLTTWLVPPSTFDHAAIGTIHTARVYLRYHLHNFTNADVCNIVNAYASVGLGLPDQDCDGIDDNTDALVDVDGDTIGDSVDNCPGLSNPGQHDFDGDGLGNSCDVDDDADNIDDSIDNCQYTPNSSQSNWDHDGYGDACDDSDFDSVVDSVDNCRLSRNLEQKDTDGDGIGDACDRDTDNDGVNNDVDNCSFAPNPQQTDSDGDAFGDACDSCPAIASDSDLDNDQDGLGNACDPDDDNDGVPDERDNCGLYNPTQRDLDQNGVGDECDNFSAQLGKDLRLKFFREQVQLLDPYQIPMDFDCPKGIKCFNWVPEEFFIELKINLETDLSIQITDDRGFVVAQSQPGLEKVLRFYPKGDFFYRPPLESLIVSNLRSENITPFQVRKYFLNIFPSNEVVPDQLYKMRIEVTSGIDEQTSLLLLQDLRFWIFIGVTFLLLVSALIMLRRRQQRET